MEQNIIATKPSTSKGKVHIKTSSSPVKVPQPNAIENPKVETSVPQSILIGKDVPEVVEKVASAPVETPTFTPPINEAPVTKESLTATLPKLTDDELLKRAGDNPILHILRRIRDIEEVIYFHNALFLELRPDPATPKDRELFLKALADLGTVQARLDTHALQIADLKEGHTDAKATPTMGGRERIQILDKATGAIYKSKNGTYQALLKAGSLKELADLGVFGANPAKNSFGWYQLKRAFPDRFEEITPEAKSVDIPKA